MKLEKNISKKGRIVTIKTSKEVDVLFFSEFASSQKDNLFQINELIIDFEHACRIDSAVLCALLKMRKDLSHSVLSFSITNCKEHFNALFHTLNFERYFSIQS